MYWLKASSEQPKNKKNEKLQRINNMEKRN